MGQGNYPAIAAAWSAIPQTAVQSEPPKVNLLVDIQAKLQAGKGAGYARWAKVFNLKQMAQTMNYLTEHGLLEYAVFAIESISSFGSMPIMLSHLSIQARVDKPVPQPKSTI